jgi:hypothetical protein
VALAVGGVRIGIGIGTFGATRRALGGLGFGEPDGATVALARLAGSRDIALGLHALSAANDRERLREAVALGTLVDAGDAVSFGSALIARDGIDRTAALNAPLGAAATAIGLWILNRL